MGGQNHNDEHDSGERGSATSETIERLHDWSSDELIGYTIVQAVATATGYEPNAMQPLQEVVNVDALDTLLREPVGDGVELTERKVTFYYQDCRVVVTSNGRVSVTPDGE